MAPENASAASPARHCHARAGHDGVGLVRGLCGSRGAARAERLEVPDEARGRSGRRRERIFVILVGGAFAAPPTRLRLALRARRRGRVPPSVPRADGGSGRPPAKTRARAVHRRVRRGVSRVHARPRRVVPGRQAREAPARHRVERLRRGRTSASRGRLLRGRKKSARRAAHGFEPRFNRTMR